MAVVQEQSPAWRDLHQWRPKAEIHLFSRCDGYRPPRLRAGDDQPRLSELWGCEWRALTGVQLNATRNTIAIGQHVIGKTVFVYLIVDGRRKMEALLRRKLLVD